ncbi:MAG TPA: IS200/IS605 family transposase [Acidobacteriaceae bacterium]
MPLSLSNVLIHVIFSTRDRLPVLNDSVRPELHAYLASTAREVGCECFRVGGVTDHVHLAIRLGRTVTVAELIKELKSCSSKWLKSQSPVLAKFSWQRGYGVFSVGPSDLGALIRYIDAQEEHHRKQDFKEEFLAFLRKYGIEFDEQHLWD